MTSIRLVISRLMSRLPESIKAVPRKLFSVISVMPVLEQWDRQIVADSPLTWPTQADAPGRSQVKIGTRQRPDLRCLLVTESMDASGVDEFVAFLARRLPSVGIEPAVLLTADRAGWREGGLYQALQSQGVRIVSEGEPRGTHWMLEFRPDVLYSHGFSEWPLRVASTYSIPALEALHGMHNVLNVPLAVLERRRAGLHGLVAVSDMVRRQYLRRVPQASPWDVVTIPNGVNRERVPTVSREAARAALGLRDEFLFVCPARFSLQKNIYALVDAFIEIAALAPQAHLLVCGRIDDKPYTRQVITLQRRSPYGDRIHLRTNTDRIDVVLAAADAFVLNSFFEGWSLASMEALGAGVPVILSDVGGASEQLNEGPAKGVLIGNPLGDPLDVTWSKIGAARFVQQSNRAELVEAMLSMSGGALALAGRSEISADSLERFSDSRCLNRHAAVLRLAAKRVQLGRPDGESGGYLGPSDQG